MNNSREFDELRARASVSTAELDAVWARLAPASIEDLTSGLWEGFGFDTGHFLHRVLRESGWYGKRFDSVQVVQPLMTRGENGELFSDLTTGKGEASLWMVEFRGEVTATMVYDGLPVFDHFKTVDDDTVMGIMNGKSIALDRSLPAGEQHFYFGLERR